MALGTKKVGNLNGPEALKLGILNGLFYKEAGNWSGP